MVLNLSFIRVNSTKGITGVICAVALSVILFLTSEKDVYSTTSGLSIAIITNSFFLIVILICSLFNRMFLFFNKADIVLAFFFLYSIITVIFKFDNSYVIYLTKLSSLYLLAYSLGRTLCEGKGRDYFFILLVILCCIESISVISEIILKLINNQINFSKIALVKGHFSNAAFLGFFMALGSLINIHILRKLEYKARIFFILILIINLITLLLVNSRSSYLFFTFGLLVLLNTSFIRIFWLTMSLALILLLFKNDSVFGRLLIWEVSNEMFQTSPVFGVGFNRFGAEYNNFQSKYFESGKGDDKALEIADNNYFSFNMFLRIIVELGLVGLFIFGYFLYVLKTNNKSSDHLLLSSIFWGILIFGQFSYPLSKIESSFLVFIFFGIMVSDYKMMGTGLLTSKIFIVFMFLSLNSVGLREYHLLKTISKWRSLNSLQSLSAPLTINLFENKIYTELKGYPEFLYNYGAKLCSMNQFSKAFPILKKCSNRMPSSDLYIYLGRTQEALGLNVDAEKSFKFSCNMVPKLFVPKYFLFRYYLDHDLLDDARRIAEKISSQTLIYNNPKITNIKNEVNLFINEN